MAGIIKYLAPVDNASGKIFGKKQSFISVTRNGSDKYYRGCAFGGARNLVKHPLSQAELDRRDRMGAIFAGVAKRISQKTSETYLQDIAAYTAQKNQPGGYDSFRKFLTADEVQKYDQTH